MRSNSKKGDVRLRLNALSQTKSPSLKRPVLFLLGLLVLYVVSRYLRSPLPNNNEKLESYYKGMIGLVFLFTHTPTGLI